MKFGVLFFLVLVGFSVQSQVLTYQAESAALTGGVTVATYGGQQCANMGGSGSITFTINVAQKAPYKIIIRAATPNGTKTQDFYLNTVFNAALAFPANANFFDYNAGTLMLNAGTNTIEIRASWGWMYFDYISLEKSAPNDYSTTVVSPINPHANAKTKAVYSYLRSQYGSNIISGQTAYWTELLTLAKKTPVVRAFDFQHYTVGYPYLWDNAIGGQTFGWEDDGTTQSAIDWYNSTGGRGIVTFQWHWHSPLNGTIGTNTFYTNSTTFDASKAVTQGTVEYTAIIRDIDSIASQVKRLQAAGVPVLFRPLHEAGGAWFWWGAKGSTTCLALYDIVYNRLTNYHGLNNIIWVWSTPEPDWYPGNAKVDIIGYDSYPGAYIYGTQKAVFNQLYTIVQGKKMIAMTENGPIPTINDCISEDAMWLYFSSWVDLVASQNSSAHVQEVYAHSQVITLDEVVLPITQTIPLQAGWNLFSINVDPLCANGLACADKSQAISTLFTGLDVEQIKTANTFWLKGQNETLNQLKTIEAGTGYLVKMNTAGTLSIIGLPYTGVWQYAPTTGWNLIGCPFQTVTSFSTYFNATNTQIIKNFEGFWIPNDALSTINELIPGKAYFLKK
jgi:mannan endo-1,4-beta-mannosidase